MPAIQAEFVKEKPPLAARHTPPESKFELFTTAVQARFASPLQVKFAAQILSAELLLDIFHRERKMCLCLTVGDCECEIELHRILDASCGPRGILIRRAA